MQEREKKAWSPPHPASTLSVWMGRGRFSGGMVIGEAMQPCVAEFLKREIGRSVLKWWLRGDWEIKDKCYEDCRREGPGDPGWRRVRAPTKLLGSLAFQERGWRAEEETSREVSSVWGRGRKEETLRSRGGLCPSGKGGDGRVISLLARRPAWRNYYTSGFVAAMSCKSSPTLLSRISKL